MRIKIVTDSAANMYTMEGVAFEAAPLTIRTDEKEYIDDANLDVALMVEELGKYKGKSGTACPGVGDWLAAFEDYDIVYCVTIISTLSGSYNAAMTAKQQYEEENPGKKVFVLDSYSAGPEMKLLLEKIKELVLAGHDYDTVCAGVTEYKAKNTSLVFSLESLHNLANNGRISPAVAKIAGLVGIRVVGDVSEEGQLHPTDKCHGEKKNISEIIRNMKRLGYKGDKVLIDHCYNEKTADSLKSKLLEEFPNAQIIIDKTTGLCSFYAEKGGLMIGFERQSAGKRRIHIKKTKIYQNETGALPEGKALFGESIKRAGNCALCKKLEK